MHVSLIDGNKSDLTPAAGCVVEDGKLEYGGLHSLVAHDVDNDGADELFGCQQLLQKAASGRCGRYLEAGQEN